MEEALGKKVEASEDVVRERLAAKGEVLRKRKLKEAKHEVWEMIAGLKDFEVLAKAIWTVLNGTDETEVAVSCEKLRSAVAAILGKDTRLSADIKRLYPDSKPVDEEVPRVHPPFSPSEASMGIACYPADSDDSEDDEAGVPTPTSSEFPYPDIFQEPSLLTLADISDLTDILVPLPGGNRPGDSPVPVDKLQQEEVNSLSVIAVSGASVSVLGEINTPPPSGPAASGTMSAEVIFRLPNVTFKAILEFFQRAVNVSRFAGWFPSHQGRQSGTKQGNLRMVSLTPAQFRELCADLYDELVRRNVEDRNRSSGDQGAPRQVQHGHPKGLHPKRVAARGKLTGLRDSRFVDLIRDVMLELEKRCLAEKVGYGSVRLSAVLGYGGGEGGMSG
ncbi:hypothetical protein VTK26DRAFT_781 [Humicola hyalothermophila]